jgi:hypothetical protein
MQPGTPINKLLAPYGLVQLFAGNQSRPNKVCPALNFLHQFRTCYIVKIDMLHVFKHSASTMGGYLLYKCAFYTEPLHQVGPTSSQNQYKVVRLHQATSEIFVESYIANKNYCQGLYRRGLSLPPIKPTTIAEPLPPPPNNPPPPQNRSRRRLKTRHCRRTVVAVAAELLPPPPKKPPPPQYPCRRHLRPRRCRRIAAAATEPLPPPPKTLPLPPKTPPLLPKTHNFLHLPLYG